MQSKPMSNKNGKSIVSRPGSELTRTRPGAAAIIDRMIEDLTDIIRTRDAGPRVSVDLKVGGAGSRDSDEEGRASDRRRFGEDIRKFEDAPEDGAEAAKWYRRAAEQGDASAQFQLGLK